MSTAESAGVVFDEVSFGYHDKVVLDQVSLTLTEHRIGIIGANGSGKSTLARLINGIHTPNSGQVTVNGLRTDRAGAAIRRQVGFIFSDPDSQIVMPTVAEDIGFSLRRERLPKRQLRERVAQIATDHGLGEYLNHPAHMLSSGQKQLLAFAAVRACKPKILVCDEPTTLLDLRNTARVMDMLSTAPEQVIVATHALEMLVGWPRVIVMDAGRVVFDGAAAAACAFYRELVQC